MTRPIFYLFAILIFIAQVPTANAQIRFEEKPAPKVGPDEEVVYIWTSSWGLRDDPPNKYPLGIATHKTKAEAEKAAKAHIAETKGNGSLAVTHYLIEGEPRVQNKFAARVAKAKELMTQLKEAKSAVDHAKKVAEEDEPLLKAAERKLGDTIKEYKEMVRQSLDRITETKKTMVSGVAAQTDIQFAKVNGLIDQFNSEVTEFQSVMGKSANLGFATMARVAKTMSPGSATTGDRATAETPSYSVFYRTKEEDGDWSKWEYLLTHPFDFKKKTSLLKSTEEANTVIEEIIKWRADLRLQFPNARHIDYEYKAMVFDRTTKKYVDIK